MGKSKSKSSQNSTNVSGSNAINGDNLGVSLSGVNNSDVNVTMTDHGAIEKAAELGELALSSNVDVSKAALDSNTEVSKAAFDLGEHAIDEVSEAHGENLQMLAGLAGNQAAQNSENLQAIKDLAEMNTDGGQVATTKQMTITVGLVMVFLSIMAFKGSS